MLSLELAQSIQLFTNRALSPVASSMRTYGIELSFIPRKGKLKEYLGKAGLIEATRIANRFNREMNRVDKLWLKTNKQYHIPFVLTAKPDTFRGGRGDNTRSYHIELNNRAGDYIYEGQWREANFTSYLKEIFKIGKTLGLTTKFVRDNKFWPTGGFHIHLGMNLFKDDGDFLMKLDRFNKSIWCDYCNRPYIKYLFDEFFDHHNSYIGVNHQDLQDLESDNVNLFDLQSGKYAIQPRWQGCAKKTMPTFEFRFFDSPRNIKELIQNLEFVNKWVGFHRGLINEGKTTEFNLTKRKLDGFTKLRDTWKEIAEFLTLLGLKPENYRGRFDTNYKNRVKLGLFKQV